MKSSLSSFRAGCLLLALLSTGLGLRAQYTYSLTDLGTISGDLTSVARAINDSSQVVGYSTNSFGDRRAFIYSGGVMTNIGTLGSSTTSQAYAINASGTIAGYSTNDSNDNHAFSYAGSFTDLGTLSPALTSFGFGINDSGMVVGQSNNHAFSYDGSLHDLGTLGGTTSRAAAINTSGQITGYAYDSSGRIRAMITSTGGSMTDLGTLTGGTDSQAQGINDDGDVVGISNGAFGLGSLHAFYLPSGGSMTDLGTLGGTNSYAFGINGTDMIVGYSYLAGDSETHAFLYSSGSLQDLNDLADLGAGGFTSLNEAYGINSLGQIVGMGVTSSGVHAFLLTPIPEPRTCTLLAGIVMLGTALFLQRRRPAI